MSSNAKGKERAMVNRKKFHIVRRAQPLATLLTMRPTDLHQVLLLTWALYFFKLSEVSHIRTCTSVFYSSLYAAVWSGGLDVTPASRALPYE